jgi:hypothetical protein
MKFRISVHYTFSVWFHTKGRVCFEMFRALFTVPLCINYSKRATVWLQNSTDPFSGIIVQLVLHNFSLACFFYAFAHKII